jgi:hypothetical protein
VHLRLLLGGQIGSGQLGPAAVRALRGLGRLGQGRGDQAAGRAARPPARRVAQFAAPTFDEKRHHFLWRFWPVLPGWGGHGGARPHLVRPGLVERVEGFATEEQWQRAYSEIVDLETTLAPRALVLAKFWMHVSPEEQLRRFESRRDDPYRAWKLTDEDWRNREPAPGVRGRRRGDARAHRHPRRPVARRPRRRQAVGAGRAWSAPCARRSRRRCGPAASTPTRPCPESPPDRARSSRLVEPRDPSAVRRRARHRAAVEGQDELRTPATGQRFSRTRGGHRGVPGRSSGPAASAPARRTRRGRPGGRYGSTAVWKTTAVQPSGTSATASGSRSDRSPRSTRAGSPAAIAAAASSRASRSAARGPGHTRARSQPRSSGSAGSRGSRSIPTRATTSGNSSGSGPSPSWCTGGGRCSGDRRAGRRTRSCSGRGRGTARPTRPPRPTPAGRPSRSAAGGGRCSARARWSGWHAPAWWPPAARRRG